MNAWPSCANTPRSDSRVDRLQAATYRAPMSTPELRQQLDALTLKLDELGVALARLLDENRSLRVSQEQLIGERAALLSKNEQARSRVEAMISRLKSLEHNA